MRATNDTFWGWDLTTQILRWNEGLQVHFGFRPNEVPPGVEYWYNCLHPEEKNRVIAIRYGAINGAEQKWSDPYRFCRADGTYAYVLDRGYVLLNEVGLAVRTLGVLIDL